MIKFKMYAEYEDSFSIEIIKEAKNCNIAEELCMNEIAAYSDSHGECIYYTCANEYDSDNNGYWVDGEWFDGFDELKGEYYKR